MKKKWNFLVSIVCIIMFTVLATGCGQSKQIAYDEAQIEQACDNIFQLISSGYLTEESVSELSEWNQGYLMAQVEDKTGIKMNAEDFATALEGWEASQEECGVYISHGDYMCEASATGVTVTTPATFSDREAELEFSFDKNLKLEAFTVNAHFSVGEIMQKAGINTVLGMGTVFLVLIFMSFLISLFKYIPALVQRKEDKKQGERKQPQASAEQVDEPEKTDETELVAVIAAAIAAYEGTTTDTFVVRSIKRRKSNQWNR